ncbi:MAG: hypothetical protein FWG96_00765 [Methanomassiliicoccaceae archaeon]|nr:hypothetical protein [Methanomassiliicoccaceae archaeon]
MNKKVVIGVFAAGMLLAVLALSVVATDWNDYVDNESPQSIDFVGTDVPKVTQDEHGNDILEVMKDEHGNDMVDENGNPIYVMVMDPNSLNFALFEKYGPLMLILALLMFGAMIGGVCVAREEVESDDTD